MKRLISSVIIIFLLAFMIGCTGKQAGAVGSEPDSAASESASSTDGPTSADQKPVTLNLYQSQNITDSEYKKLIEEPLKKKFPNITIIRTNATTATLDEVIATGNIPDFFYDGLNYHKYQKLGLLQDLEDLIKKHNFDLNRLKSGIIDSIKNQTNEGIIFTLPFSINTTILYYNKDIFDKFGVPYPPDEQITWEKAVEIGRKLTRTDNGINYVGIDLENGPLRIYESLGLKVLDSETGKATVNTSGWKRVLDVVKSSFEVPGYVQGDKYIYDKNSFLKTRNLAMRVAPLANLIGDLEDARAAGQPINYDIVPPPAFEENFGKGSELAMHTWYISSQSKHKDEAFQVISYILSDEVQRLLARNGRVPCIENKELEKEFGADVPSLQGVNTANVFKAEPRIFHKAHPYEGDVTGFIQETYEEIALKNVDVNTALRNLEEKINKKVDQLKVAGK
ncbi:bacterial extracellular solute-binding protein [Ruminiclostridium hungatei]|uniref:Bacterial extracellular solute-binding protein n=1 Tax=Ruminiclostridium hungatei TaxID=48256 RepID=A0A1V4SM77_RUMHU|nr:extracellular solute-binding protein [Ruminiclostridium hungatei]OPX44978.1 bacterial extracellular solute-binding protein [Ruminiclostridium hungatei]